MTAADLVRREVDANGPISFSRYMELALYDPEFGFYADGGAGRRRDFITSAETGPLFGAVVARALDTWWHELGCPATFTFVDAGAGPGTLARSILRAEPECAEALDYVAVETSAAQRARHPDTITSVAEMPESVELGVVFANELLDNLPFDICQFVPGEGWSEVRVGISDGGVVEVLVPTGHEPLQGGDLNRRSRVPIPTHAVRWLTRTLASVGTGWVVVIDYAVDRYPVADRDWLRTYSGHERAGSPLDDPGSKDITADVDISALRAVRPTSDEFIQSAWLLRHGIEELVEQGRAYWHQHAAAPDIAAVAMRSRVSEAEALLDPEGFGGFAVLEWTIASTRPTSSTELH